MGRKPISKSQSLITPFEIKILSALWALRSGRVSEVLDWLREHKPQSDQPLAYTTVSTVLRQLETKGVVQSFKDGRSHIYAPILTRDAHAEFLLREIISNIFANDQTAFWSCLLATDIKSDFDHEEILQRLTQ